METLSTSVGAGSDVGPNKAGVYGWDWSSTTHDARGSGGTVAEIVTELLEVIGGAHHVPGKGLQGWAQSVESFDCDGYRLGRVYFGGERTDVHVVATSSAADVVRPDVVSVGGARTSRVDTRVDSSAKFEDLEAVLRDASNLYGSVLTTMSSEVRGESKGRTVYLGAPSSAVRVRLYEKWLESPGQYAEGTNRVEVQLRPPSRVKWSVSDWSPAQTFCASKVTRTLAERLGADWAPKASLHVSRGTPDLERSLRAMGEQYGRSVEKWLTLSGGDVGKVLDYLNV